jgi:SAM-dependent methyltransferase
MNFLYQRFVANKKSWVLSNKLGMAVDDDNQNIPWFNYLAVDFLQKYCQKNSNLTVFEFGCGSSTLFFQKYSYRTFSLETNKNWFKIITQKLSNIAVGQWNENYFSNQNSLCGAEVFLLENAYQNPNYYHFLANNFQHRQFDIILIDSLHRKQCALNSIEFLKPNGLLIVDDFERKNYHKIAQYLEKQGFYCQNFIDLAMGQLKIKQTAIFSINKTL